MAWVVRAAQAAQMEGQVQHEDSRPILALSTAHDRAETCPPANAEGAIAVVQQEPEVEVRTYVRAKEAR